MKLAAAPIGRLTAMRAMIGPTRRSTDGSRSRAIDRGWHAGLRRIAETAFDA